jgi:hypothetical protein
VYQRISSPIIGKKPRVKQVLSGKGNTRAFAPVSKPFLLLSPALFKRDFSDLVLTSKTPQRRPISPSRPQQSHRRKR